MLKRIITGVGYVAVMVGFFLLRELVNQRLFHILIAFFAVAGTFEVARAVKSYAVKGTFYTATVFGALLVPVYCIGEYWAFNGLGFMFAVDFMLIGFIVVSVICLFEKEVKRQTFLFSLLPYAYPALFIILMLCANDFSKGFTVLLLSFVISPLSDTFAYFIGKMLQGPKLCPKLSPKKTWSGAIGGTIGGIVGALIVYFIFPISTSYIAPVLVFIIAGVLGSIINIFGDLFESFIKRRVGIKDMGKLLPGHGGVMDRIDGTSFVVAILYPLFLIF